MWYHQQYSFKKKFPNVNCHKNLFLYADRSRIESTCHKKSFRNASVYERLEIIALDLNDYTWASCNRTDDHGSIRFPCVYIETEVLYNQFLIAIHLRTN